MGIDISNLAGGAVAERINIEAQRIFENIADPNTEWKKVRKLTVTLTFQPDEERDIALVGVDAKTTLAPAKGVATKVVLGTDGSGKIVGAELKSGVKNQMMMDADGDLADDTGNKIVGFNKNVGGQTK